MTTQYARRFIAAFASLTIVVSAHANIFTTQSATSHVDANGTTQLRSDDTQTDGFASTAAIWPAGTNIGQARTAARSRASEIAANARVFNDSFANGRVFDLALSQAVYAVHFDPVPIGSHMGVDFFLPPSYVEIVTNAELPTHTLNATFVANLMVCQTAFCTLSDSRFYFQVDGEATYRNAFHSIIADGDPTLDLTPLRNPVVTDTTDGLRRTYLVEFAAYRGHIDLGFVAGGTDLNVEYLLQARAWGPAVFSSAIASINDPFTVNGDPVQDGVPLVPVLGPVPEASTWALMFCGIVTLYVPLRRRCRLSPILS